MSKSSIGRKMRKAEGLAHSTGLPSIPEILQMMDRISEVLRSQHARISAIESLIQEATQKAKDNAKLIKEPSLKEINQPGLKR